LLLLMLLLLLLVFGIVAGGFSAFSYPSGGKVYAVLKVSILFTCAKRI